VSESYVKFSLIPRFLSLRVRIFLDKYRLKDIKYGKHKEDWVMINKETLIYDALRQKPGCEKIFLEFGMHCLGCPVSRGENIGQAAEAHGIDLDKLLKALEDFKS